MPGSGPRQAIPEKAVQPKGKHEKETAPLQAMPVRGDKNDLHTWETFLQSYNGITMFGHMTTTGERGICVTTSSHGWRVEKGGQFLSRNWPKALSARIAAHGAALLPWLVVAKAWGDTLKDTRLVMEVANDDLVSLVNTQNGVVRKWLGLLKHNIHCVTRRVPVNFNSPTSSFAYFQVPIPDRNQLDIMTHPLQSSVQDGHGIEVKGGNTVGQLLGRKLEENI